MAGFGVTSKPIVLHDGSSAQSSTVTSNAVWCGDGNVLSVSIQSVAAVASVWSLEGNNGDGFLTALGTGVAGTDWSTVTAITAQGIYSITPGMRWLRLIRPAVNSQASVVIAIRST
jgi:hypothetical protein